MSDKPREPYERALSAKVKLFFGFKDGRAELKVMTPIGITVPATIPPVAIPTIKKVFDEAYDFNSKSEEERKRAGGPWEREVEVRAKITFGFPDGHVVISVRPAKIVPWLSVDITREEHLQGKKAMDEVFMWYQLPSDVREMQGAA
jgi:hypothetical protein